MTHTPQKWKKKPVVIEAMQYDGTPESFNAIMDWARPVIGKDAIGSSALNIRIDTLEGTMTAQEGDWIIRGVKDEFYPCKPDIFERTYEPANTPEPTDPAADCAGRWVPPWRVLRDRPSPPDPASLRAELEMLRRYAGTNLVRSDFRTADDMRAAYDHLRAEVERLRKENAAIPAMLSACEWLVATVDATAVGRCGHCQALAFTTPDNRPTGLAFVVELARGAIDVWRGECLPPRRQKEPPRA